MIITINATLTEEQIEILSNMKGYQPTVSVTELQETIIPEIIAEDGTITPESISNEYVTYSIANPVSRAEFIRKQYEGLINYDASNEYIRHTKKQREQAERLEEEEIRANVSVAITSSVE